MISKIETPRANPEKLLDLIQMAYQAKVVLPEFQRSFVWAREDIEELLISILQGYFIGTFLILDTPPNHAMFPFRTVEGLEKVNPNGTAYSHPTVRLVLDGQQRLTSLFYVLHEPAIPLRDSQNPYQFFLRLDLLLDGNPDDAVYGISLADRRRLSEMQRMLDNGTAIRFSLFRDSSQFYHWLYQSQKTLEDQEKQIVEGFYRRFADFLVPVVSISPEAGKENIVNIFERINRTGVSLSLFDLAAARLYLKGIRLRELWEDFEDENKTLAKIIKQESILKMISIWENKGPRKSALLDVIDELDKTRFEEQWHKACYWLSQAYQRVTSPQGYGAFDTKWIPYTTLLVPLALLLNFVSEKHGGEEMYRKIDCWYWGSVFTQRYDQAVDTTTYRDVRAVREWLEGGPRLPWLDSFQSNQVELSEIEEQRSSIYRGAMCLIVRAGAKDFINGQAATLTECQDDHIFPRTKYQHETLVNSILNRTLISSTSNQIKSNKRPSEYLPLFLQQHGGNKERLQATLNSHFIPEEAQKAMEHDDFSAFIAARKLAFQKEIAQRVKGDL